MKFRNKIIIPIIVCLAVIFIAGFFVAYFFKVGAVHVSINSGLEKRTITVGSTKIPVEVAATASEQKLGLSYRRSLAPNAGMLFPIIDPAQTGFWMNGMNFPLDFIYFDQGRVVETKDHVSNFDLTPFFPNEAVDAVLEVNAGYVASHGISVGDASDY